MLGRKKKEDKDNDSRDLLDIATTQDFVGISDIQEGIIELPGGRYRAILQITGGINFALMSEAEQDQVEAAFRNFIRGLTGTVEFFTHTSYFDAAEYVKALRVASVPEGMKWFADLYLVYLEQWAQNRSVTVKQSYVVIGYDSSDRSEAKKEIWRRIDVLMQEFGSWLRIRPLDTVETAELLYQILNKEQAGLLRIKDMISSGYLAPVVRGLSFEDLRGQTKESGNENS